MGSSPRFGRPAWPAPKQVAAVRWTFYAWKSGKPARKSNPMDALSDVLSLMRPRAFVVGGFDLGGDWSIRFDAHDGIKVWSVVSGRCVLRVDGAAPALLDAGDCVLLPRGCAYTLMRDQPSAPMALGDLPMTAWSTGVATVNGGGETLILGGHFDFTGAQADLLLGALPALVRLRDPDGSAGLRWALERTRDELIRPAPGGALVVRHLAQLMLVQVLRLYLAEGPAGGAGWLSGLAHPRIAAAIAAVHADPGAPWTLRALAERAGMSRSAFAAAFTRTVGVAPMAYLARWRMLLAGARLRQRRESVSAIGLSLGYGSEAAFSTAFRRLMGCSPGRYARRPAEDPRMTLWRPAVHSGAGFTERPAGNRPGR